MSSSWNEVPNKTLDIVLLYLNVDDDLLNSRRNSGRCSLTCSRWKTLAQTVLFSEVHLLTTRDFEEISPIVLNNNKLGKSVKVLHYTSNCEFNMAVLLAIDLLFPNLNKLVFKGPELLYSTFIKIENKKFNNLTALPIPKNAKEAEMYLKCLDYLKDRNTCIELFDDNSNKSLYRNVHNELGNYPKLKELVIHSPFNNVDLNIIVSYLRTTFDSNLNSLQLISIVSASDSTYFNLFTAEKRDTLLLTKTVEAVYIDMFNITSKIPSEEFMLLIMDKFPGLKTFEWLEKNSQILHRYLVPSESLSATLLLFLKYIMKIPNCTIPNIIMAHNNTIKLVEDLYAEIEKNNLIVPPLSPALRVVVYYFGDRYYDIRETNLRNNYPRLQETYFEKTCAKDPFNIDHERIEIVKRIGRFLTK